MLSVHDVSVHFAGLRALNGVDAELCDGEMVGLIGPNGAGKTTLLNVLSGFQSPSTGRVCVDGAQVKSNPRGLSRRGVARTFQSVRIFGRLSVRENIEVASVAAGVANRAARDRADELLDAFRLVEHAERPAGTLAQGDERRLGVARAVAREPRFLLLDEPWAGLNEEEGDAFAEVLETWHRGRRCAVMIIEHDMRIITRLCKRVQVLDHGVTLAQGGPAEVRRDPAVIDAYLGSSDTGEAAT